MEQRSSITQQVVLFCVLCILASCNGTKKDNKEQTEMKPNIKEQTFDELFRPIEAVEITDNVFKLNSQDFMVLTAGQEDDFNSMTAGWGGWGQIFKPSTWLILRANRYTLEYMKREESYTICYFPEEHNKEQVFYFGSMSGRNSDKMKNNPLSYVKTPSGNIAYKESNFIIECKLWSITTVNPNDFYTEEGRNFIEEAFDEAKDYHKLVLGEITNVWVKK